MAFAALRRSVVAAALVSAAALCSQTSAEPIMVMVSTVASGMLGSTSFTNSLVTVTDTFSSEQLQACIANAPANCSGPGLGYLFAPESPGVLDITEMVTVAGVGFGIGGGGGIYVSTGSQGIALGEIAGFFSLDVLSPAIPLDYAFGSSLGPVTGSISETLLGDNCYLHLPASDCPVGLHTDAGELVLTSVADTATGQVVVGTPASVTPEPGTWIMVGTGLLGGLGTVRRRGGR